MSVRSVVFDVIARDRATPAFKSASRSAAMAATGIDRSLARMERRSATMMAAGTKLSKSLTLPVLAFAAYGVKQAAAFEKQMALLRTAAGESETNMRQITGGIKKVSSDTATSLHDLTEGMYVVAKAAKSRGWTGTEQLVILRAAAQGAKAENVGLAVATDALSTVMTDYHSKASDAVKVENQLIKASGLAKTNFGLFSESLSNVTPIAAALGISFAEVGGSLATMTQHGVNAQQATQNMRNLMFNLAGQNNVASQAMQQLGIDTVDLSKNLRSRGLTGSLAIVDAALKKHTKNGMVVTDVHKAATLATRSLSTMMGTFTGKLKDQSKGLVSGKVGIAEYTKFAKTLGGQAGAGALQFRSLFLNSQGFSNQLKSGKGTLSTSVGQYQKLLGGMTGASVAMQIAGKYAGDNAKNVKAVGDAAKHAGKDVHGWELTQKTLSYKLKDAGNKASLLATAVGEKLLPFVSMLADGATKAFKWFDNLSSGTKKFLGITLLVGAALGPVISLLGFATRGFVLLFGFGVKAVQFAKGLMLVNVSLATMNSRAWAAGFSMNAMFSRMASGSLTAAKGVGAALGGAGIGASIGMLTRQSSGATKAVGALGSAAAGAAAGFAMGGGPWGAAIGGAAGLLGNLAANFLGAGNSARDAIKPTDEYTNALLRSKGAIDGTVRSMVASDLQKKGAYDAGLKIGIDQKTLTDAASGNAGALARVRAAQQGYTLASLKGGKQAEEYIKANHKLNDVLGDTAKTLDVNRRAANNLAAANSTAGKNDSARAAALKQIPKLQKAAADSLARMNTQVGVHGASLDAKKLDGRSNASFLSQQVKAYNAIATAQFRSGTALGSVNKGLRGSADQLRKQALEAGFSESAVDGLIAKYRLTPKQIITDMVANIGKATASSAQLQTTINNIKQGKVPGLTADSRQGRAVIAALQARANSVKQNTPTLLKVNPIEALRTAQAAQTFIDRIRQNKIPDIKANSAAAESTIARLQGIINAALGNKTISIAVIPDFSRIPGGYKAPKGAKTGGGPNGDGTSGSGRAAGGGAPEGWFAVGEEGPELAHKRGNRVDILSNRQSKAFINRTGWTFPGFAKGTGGITRSGKDWVFNGTRYASERAAQNARDRASKSKKKADQSALSSGVSDRISGIGQAASSPFTLSDVGVSRMGATLRSAVSKLNEAITKGLESKSARSFRGQIARMVVTANRQLGALRLKIRTSDMAALRAGLKSTVEDTRSALSQMLTDLSRSGASRSVLTAVRTAGARLTAMQNQLGKEKDRLSSMGEFRSGIAGTLRGGFDPTQAGSVEDMLYGLGGATQKNKVYSAEVSGLLGKAKGNKTLTDYINQLAENGNSAGLDSLAGASNAQLQSISKAVASYNSSVSKGADIATLGKFGETYANQAQDIANLTSSMTAQANAIGQLVAVLPALRFNLDGKPIDAKLDKHDQALLQKIIRQLTKGS